MAFRIDEVATVFVSAFQLRRRWTFLLSVGDTAYERSVWVLRFDSSILRAGFDCYEFVYQHGQSGLVFWVWSKGLSALVHEHLDGWFLYYSLGTLMAAFTS
jgi:hypothetical protein